MSFASVDPKYGDLYLQELWQLDELGNFVEPIPDSFGAWVSRDVMDYVEFLIGEDEFYESGPSTTDNEPQG